MARGFLIPRFQRPSSPKLTIERILSPEEEELDGLLDWSAQNELELETLNPEINSIFTTYNAAVLPKVAEAKRLRAADEAEVGSPGDIVKITTYVTSINDWRASALEQQSLFNEYFKDEYPANTLVEITALAEPEDRVGPR